MAPVDLIENAIRQRDIGHFDWLLILNFVSACGLAFGTAWVGKLYGACSATRNPGRFKELHKTLHVQTCWRTLGWALPEFQKNSRARA